MNLQKIDLWYFICAAVLIAATVMKDRFGPDLIAEYKELDKSPDVLTEDEREFLDQYRCETMDIEEILHDFVTSGKFGQYASNYETKNQEGDDIDMVIYKRAETFAPDGTCEMKDIEIEY